LVLLGRTFILNLNSKNHNKLPDHIYPFISCSLTFNFFLNIQKEIFNGNHDIFNNMSIVEKISKLGDTKVSEKLAAIQRVCPKDYFLFYNFFEQDDQNQISYTIGAPFEIHEFPLNINKCFIQEIYRNSHLSAPFNISRTVQLLQEVSKENELSMIYFSDEGEREFCGFGSVLWSYHPGHKNSHQKVLALSQKIYFLMFGQHSEVTNLPQWLNNFEIGHIGTAFRSGQEILKIYLRLTYGDIFEILRNLNCLEKEHFKFLNEFSNGKTIFFLDMHKGNFIRYGFEVRTDLINNIISDHKKFKLPDNIFQSLLSFKDICKGEFPNLTHIDKQFRFHHLKTCFTPNTGIRWKAYYAYCENQ
jgi:hypothetical protein